MDLQGHGGNMQQKESSPQLRGVLVCLLLEKDRC